MQKKCKNGLNADGVAQRKKKKRRGREGPAIAKICVASKEADPRQVGPSLNPLFHCRDSAITQKRIKKKKRLRNLQKCEVLSDEASSEKEKQSLLAWVEMCMEPRRSDNSVEDLHGDLEMGRFANGSSVSRSLNGHTHSLTVCAGNDTCGRRCNGDAFAAALENGVQSYLPNGHAFTVDHEGHVCGEQSLSNGPNCQSNHYTKSCSFNVQSSHEGLSHAVATNYKECLTSKNVNGSSQARSIPVGQSSRVSDDKISAASHTSTYAQQWSSLDASRSGESNCSCLAGATDAHQRGFSNGHIRSDEDVSSCHALDLETSKNSSLLKKNDSVSLSNSTIPHTSKRKREDDKVLQYVLKRSIVVYPSPFKPLSKKSRTTKTAVIAWGRNIPVTLTSEACMVQEWISAQSGNLFGLDVEWRPNRAKNEKNKVALLQLCNENECLIIQMLFLDQKPQALRKLLSDPLKSLAGVGVLADGKRLLRDYGLECRGAVELTTLAVERLKRDELRNVGLKVLVQEVLGLKMDKPKKVTLSNWAKVELDPAQITYACMDAWASFALSHKLLVDM